MQFWDAQNNCSVRETSSTGRYQVYYSIQMGAGVMVGKRMWVLEGARKLHLDRQAASPIVLLAEMRWSKRSEELGVLLPPYGWLAEPFRRVNSYLM